MKVIFLPLFLLAFSKTNHCFLFNVRNALPWVKDMPADDYRKHVNVHLVKKDWRPKGPKVPGGNGVTDQYSGTTEDAFKIFMDEGNMYQYEIKPLDSAIDLFSESYGYDPKLESIFVVHTISGDAFNYFVKNTMLALALRNFHRRYNIFAFNMPGMQDSMEQTIIKSIFGMRANYYEFSETIGVFFDAAIQKNLLQPSQIHFIGFCYSSTLIGYISRHISSKNNNQKVKSILALDPYSIGLSGIRYQILTKDDAQVVHAYHTNSMAYGSLYRKATADFVFNSGLSQPGCYTSTNVMCSHRRAVTAFWYVILYPKLWVGRKCSSWAMFKTCFCNRNKTARLTFPPTPGPSGNYYFNTASHKPYGYGPPGANCYTRNPYKKSKPVADKTINMKELDFTKAKNF